MSSQFAESLQKQYVGQQIGWVLITALKDAHKGLITKVVAICSCKCNKQFERKLSQLIDSQRRSATTPSCGCFRKTGMSETIKRANRERKQMENSLTYTEQQQVQRILDSRTNKVTAVDRREAIECVIRDRQTGDLVCHGGDDDIL